MVDVSDSLISIQSLETQDQWLFTRAFTMEEVDFKVEFESLAFGTAYYTSTELNIVKHLPKNPVYTGKINKESVSLYSLDFDTA
jgi:hypothetical protein